MSVTGREWRRQKQNKNHVMRTIFLVNLSATNIDEMQVNIQWGIFWDDADVADVINIIHSEKNVDDWEVLSILNYDELSQMLRQLLLHKPVAIRCT